MDTGVKEEIIELLKSTHRKGIDVLIAGLEASTFFSARCARHHRYEGGLAMHSLGTYRFMQSSFNELNRDSVIIVALLHDVCKAYNTNWYTCGLKPNGSHSHSSRSLAILRQCGVELSDDEAEAIECHMHHATNQNPLWHAIKIADGYDASHGH